MNIKVESPLGWMHGHVYPFSQKNEKEKEDPFLLQVACQTMNYIKNLISVA